jgi:predicted phage terminase large subunit-like protein
MVDPQRLAALREAAAEELARRDLAAFAQRVMPGYDLAPHAKLILDTLAKVESGEIKRLVISQPPQTGKSTALQLLCAYALGRDPSRRIVTASYGEELAFRNSRIIRELIKSPSYPFAARLAADSRAADRFNIAGERGGLLSVGVGSGLTGFSADLMILDDLVKDFAAATSAKEREALEAWLSTVALTRLSKDARIVLAGTRWSYTDIMSSVLSGPNAESWHVLNLPALSKGEGDALDRPEGATLWPAWKSEEDLDDLRMRLGSQRFSALYQGEPTPDGGAVFRAEWFAHTYDLIPGNAQTFFTLDTALSTSVSANYSVILVAASDGKELFIRDIWRGRWDYPTLRARLLECYAAYAPTRVFIEAASSGLSILSELKNTPLPLIPIKPGHESKTARAESVAGWLEAGKVRFPSSAPWKAALIEEAMHFPAGAQDDQVDALVNAIQRLRDTEALSHRGGMVIQPLISMLSRATGPRVHPYLNIRV